jgi:hypothetical protein
MQNRGADAYILDWARKKHYTFYYCRERDLPAPCLKVNLGQLTAHFHAGRLVRLVFQIEGNMLEDACRQLTELRVLCVDRDPGTPAPAVQAWRDGWICPSRVN